MKNFLQIRSCVKLNLYKYRHSLIYAVNVGTHKKKHGKQKPRKSRLLSSTKGEENRIELGVIFILRKGVLRLFLTTHPPR